METIKYKLSKKKIEFLQNMQEYLDTKLYFYGSIQRFDYIDNVSDIDICIFTDNMDSTILSLQQYLNVEKKYIKVMVMLKIQLFRYSRYPQLKKFFLTKKLITYLITFQYV